MTQEEKNIKICEALGWRWQWFWFRDQDESFARPSNQQADFKELVPANYISGPRPELPNHFADLNACHEMEKVIDAGLLAKYTTELLKVCGGPMSIHFATAAQRAEAFGLTLGLWT